MIVGLLLCFISFIIGLIAGSLFDSGFNYIYENYLSEKSTYKIYLFSLLQLFLLTLIIYLVQINYNPTDYPYTKNFILLGIFFSQVKFFVRHLPIEF